MLMEAKRYLDISISFLNENNKLAGPLGHSGKHARKSWEIGLDGQGNAPKCIKSLVRTTSMKILNTGSKYCDNCTFCLHENEHQSIAIPLLNQHSIVGILSVCFQVDHELDENEIDLLEEAAGDLAFAYIKNKAEKALSASEEQYRIAFNTSPDLFYRISPEGKIQDCNDSVIEVLGYSKDELIGMPLMNIYAPESKSIAKKFFNEWKQTGKLRNKELKVITKKGKKIKIGLSVNTIYDDKGNVVSSISNQHVID
jgi:PAS domain S-box-containing protein